MTTPAQEGVYVGPARTGQGIFATRAFKPGDPIVEVRFVREIDAENPLSDHEDPDHCTFENGRLYLVAEPACYTNHSCDPNAYKRDTKGGSSIVARRAIDPDEEVTLDYLINNEGGNSWPCACGAARCRGTTGTRFFDLPPAFQREYTPLLAPWFRTRHADRLAALPIDGDIQT